MCEGRSNTFNWLTKIGLCSGSKVTFQDQDQSCKKICEARLLGIYQIAKLRNHNATDDGNLQIYIQSLESQLVKKKVVDLSV